MVQINKSSELNNNNLQLSGGRITPTSLALEQTSPDKKKETLLDFCKKNNITLDLQLLLKDGSAKKIFLQNLKINEGHLSLTNNKTTQNILLNDKQLGDLYSIVVLGNTAHKGKGSFTLEAYYQKNIADKIIDISSLSIKNSNLNSKETFKLRLEDLGTKDLKELGLHLNAQGWIQVDKVSDLGGKVAGHTYGISPSPLGDMAYVRKNKDGQLEFGILNTKTAPQSYGVIATWDSSLKLWKEL